MTTPARRHFQKMIAAKAAADNEAQQPQTGDAYQLMKAALIEDRRRLHDIQSIERKIELKKTLLPQYEPYIQGVLSAGNGAQDDVLMTLMVWLFDVGDLEKGIAIAEYALRHQLEPAEQYQRKTATIVAEESSDTALRNLGEHQTPESLLAQLQQVAELTNESDMHDQVRAKLFKAIGYTATKVNQFDLALASLKRALELHEHVGVKKDIEKLEREIKKAAEASST